MKDPLAVLNAIHQVIISAGAPSVDENSWVLDSRRRRNHGKTMENVHCSPISSIFPLYQLYHLYQVCLVILSPYYPYSALVLTCFDALALDFGRIDFRSLLANDYRHGIAVRGEDFRLGKPRWQHGVKV